MAYIKLLANVPLDNSYKNPVLFTDAELPENKVKVTYDSFFTEFDANWQPSDSNGLRVNFKVGNGINTNIVVPKDTYSPTYNYLIVKFEEDEVKPSTCKKLPLSTFDSLTYFYFITNAVPISRDNYALSLELDVMTTYFTYLKLDHKVFTERKHCNRWKSSGVDAYTLEHKDAILGDEIDANFDANVIKDIVRPEYNFISSTSKAICNATTLPKLNRYINTMWVYLFYTQLPCPANTGTSQANQFSSLRDEYVEKHKDITLRLGQYDTSLYCVAIPLSGIELRSIKNSDTYGDSSKVLDPYTTWRYNYSATGGYFSIYYDTETDTIHTLFEDASLVGAKLSFRPPFAQNQKYVDGNDNRFGMGWDEVQYGPEISRPYIQYTPENNGLTINKQYGGLGKYHIGKYDIGYGTSVISYGGETDHDTYKSYEMYTQYLLVSRLDDAFITSEFIDTEVPNITSYEVNALINGYKNNYTINYEPKLHCQPYYKYVVSSQYGGEYTYSPLLIGTEYKVVICCEITAEPDKIYFTIKPDVNSVYYKFSSINNGVTIINDNNIPYSSDAYKTYLATHRASYITSLAVPLVSGITKTAVSVATQQYGNAVSSAVDTIGNVVKYQANIIDLKKTPDTMKNMGNNPIHDYAMQNYTYPYIIKYELFDNEKQQVYDYYYDYGYKVNRKCYLKLNDFTDTENIITRQKFNYIKINDDITNEMQFVSDDGSVSGVYHNVPQIVRKKINDILNAGTKLWTLIYTDVEYSSWTHFYLGSDYENAEIYLPE